MKDYRINPNETDREREIRIGQSPAFDMRDDRPTVELFRTMNGWMAKHSNPDIRLNPDARVTLR